MAADQLQRTGTKTAVDPEPLTGLNIVADTTANGHISEKPIAFAEVDRNSVADMDSNASVDNKFNNKKESVVEANKEFSTVDENLEIAEPQGKEKEDGLDGDIGGTNMQMEIGSKKNNKNQKKPKSQRGLNKPTGFEEYYVDPPVTPAEYEEERSIYHISLPFAQRIEKAIQRFQAKRKLDSNRKNVFDKYLLHGGVDAGQNMFTGGLDADFWETRTAAEIADLRATTFVGADKIDIGKSDHVVDFEGCLASFLSNVLPRHFELHSEEKIKSFVGIIRNFFNYLLYHDVCPDYKDQIYAARDLCDKAEKELWNLSLCTPMLPGDFNKACSEIFGGMYQGMWSENQEWMQGIDLDYAIGISPHHARKVFKYALAANADDDTHASYQKQLKEKSIKIVGVNENTGFEVTEIVFANRETLDFYAQPECAELKPIGKMKAKSWIIPTAADEDLTEEEEAALAAKVPEPKYYEFWVEDEILSKCVVGMKFEGTVTELSFGVSYFDTLDGVHCSFYQVLPNEMVLDWREPEREWLPMKKKGRAAKGDGDVDDGPGDDGEADEMLDNNTALGEQPLENTKKGVTGPENESHGTDGNMGHATEASGNHSEIEGTSEVQITDVPIDVRKTGEKVIQVPGNAEKIVEKTFDIEPRYDD